MSDALSPSALHLLKSLGYLPALWHESTLVKILTSAAVLGAVVAVLKAVSGNGKKVTDYRRIARSLATGERSGDHKEFDVVIVGGGKSVWACAYSRLTFSSLHRHVGVCTCLPAFGEPKAACLAPGDW